MTSSSESGDDSGARPLPVGMTMSRLTGWAAALLTCFDELLCDFFTAGFFNNVLDLIVCVCVFTFDPLLVVSVDGALPTVLAVDLDPDRVL